MLAGFTLPAELEAHDPPEARGLSRDGVRLMVSRRSTGQISHHRFRDVPGLLLPGDLLVVNDTGTLPAQVRASRELAVHFSTPLPDGAWLVELRVVRDKISKPNGPGFAGPGHRPAGRGGADPGEQSHRPAVAGPALGRSSAVSTALRHSDPVLLRQPRLAAGRVPDRVRAPAGQRRDAQRQPAVTPAVVTDLAARGVLIAPLTLHTGVSSLEAGEDPYPEPYDVPATTAGLVNHVRAHGGRVIAGGTTVVRALETAARPDGTVGPAAGWTSHVVTPQTGVKAVDGLLTGLHEPRSSHLRMLAAFAGPELLSSCYQAAIAAGYLWHEFGDVHLLLP